MMDAAKGQKVPLGARIARWCSLIIMTRLIRYVKRIDWESQAAAKRSRKNTKRTGISFPRIAALHRFTKKGGVTLAKGGFCNETAT